MKQGRRGVPYLHRSDGEFRAVEKIRLAVNTARPQEDAVTTARGGSNLIPLPHPEFVNCVTMRKHKFKSRLVF